MSENLPSENLLTKDELFNIFLESANTIYRDRFIITLPLPYEKSRIMKVGKRNGVILVWGNDDTAFVHIKNRHDIYSEKYFWKAIEDKSGNEKIILDDPSRFRGDTVPVYHFTEIADNIFSNEFFNLNLNKRPEVFDMYTGDFEHGDGTKAVYNLLTYKSTSIIHNLFPKTKTFNKKRFVNLIRGDVTGELNIMSNIYETRIPYLDHKGIKYTIILRDFLHKKKRVMFVSKIDKSTGRPLYIKIEEREIDGVLPTTEELMFFNLSDFSEYDKLIAEINRRDTASFS